MSEFEKVNIRKLSDDGYIWFTIRAEDSEYNESIHSAFKGFCKEETRNDYTLGLKQLLEGYNVSRQVGALWGAFNNLEKEVVELRESGSLNDGSIDKDSEDEEMF